MSQNQPLLSAASKAHAAGALTKAEHEQFVNLASIDWAVLIAPLLKMLVPLLMSLLTQWIGGLVPNGSNGGGGIPNPKKKPN